MTSPRRSSETGASGASAPSARFGWLIDLDHTLFDREAVFAAWATWLDPTRSTELIELDQRLAWPAFDRAVAAGWPARFANAGAFRAHLQEQLPTFVPARPELADVLGSLPGPLGLLSNGSVTAQRAKLRRLGLESCFDAILISGELGVEKPDRAIFQRALAALGCDRGCMVGDDPVRDIAGARAAGLRTCWISWGRDWPGGPRPDLVVPRIERLPALCETVGWIRRANTSEVCERATVDST